LRWCYHRGAYFVDKILRGTPPGELPVEFPTKMTLSINLKTAKAHLRSYWTSPSQGSFNVLMTQSGHQLGERSPNNLVLIIDVARITEIRGVQDVGGYFTEGRSSPVIPEPHGLT
jgi:hypothetical protein